MPGIARHEEIAIIEIMQSPNLSSDDPWPSDRTLTEIGLVCAFVAIAGIGVPMIFPDYKSLGITIVAVGLLGAFAVLLLIAKRKAEQRQIGRGRQMVLLGTVLIILGFIVGLIGAFHTDHPEMFGDTKPKTPKNYGALKPNIEPIISGGHLFRTLQIADSGARFIQIGSTGAPLIKIFEDTDLNIEVVDGQLKVSTKFRDKSGKMVAELIRNEWKVAPAPTVWDRNYSNDALEVKGPDGNIFLQIRILPDCVQMAGIWYGPNSTVFAMAKSPTGNGGIFVFRPPLPVIHPIFKYPSELHLGEFVKD